MALGFSKFAAVTYAVVGAASATAQAGTTGPILDSVASKFEQFKATYNRQYESAEEELARFKIFVKNLESASKMQMLEQASATYGHLSPFADQSSEEFNRRNNLPVTPKLLKEHAQQATMLSADIVLKTPSEWDWNAKGAVTEVKNQAQCGSCWAFATVANIEGQNFLVNKELISLAEQELVDCSGSDDGCDGGVPSRAYQDLIKTDNGLELEKDYPYTAKDGSCSWVAAKEKVFLAGWLAISKDESQIAAALVQYGPLAIAVNAEPMQMYMGGISDPWFCSPSGIDHAVTLTGFGTEDKKDFWSIKNSWGASWGESGYYRLIRGKGKCGMNLMVATSKVAPKGASKGSNPMLYV